MSTDRNAIKIWVSIGILQYTKYHEHLMIHELQVQSTKCILNSIKNCQWSRGSLIYLQTKMSFIMADFHVKIFQWEKFQEHLITYSSITLENNKLRKIRSCCGTVVLRSFFTICGPYMYLLHAAKQTHQNLRLHKVWLKVVVALTI